MEVVNKLAQLLNIDEDQHGIVSEISNKTGLSRSQVSELLHNKAKGVRYETLAKICQYLIDKELVDATQLPGALLGFAPNEFWPMLYERRRIEFCMGTRRDPQWYDELVMAADSELRAKLTHRITQYSSLQKTNGLHREMTSRDGLILDECLIAAPTREGDNEQETIRESREICEQFDKEKNDKAFVCLGSVKSNSVIERFVSQCFDRTTAFESQDEVDTPGNRTCPFTIIFRPEDPKLNSCCGGRQLSQKNLGAGPGIYFEGSEAEWSHVPCDKHRDGAIVFYRYHKSLRNLSMCLGGYSSRATRFLADFLHSGDEDAKLWPPVFEDGEIQIGLFVLQFTLHESAKGPRSGSVRSQKSHSTSVFPVSEEGIRRRIRPTAHKRGTRDHASHEMPKPR
jgi:transcriptional regulator with XRE-family HTH domain